MSEGDKWTKEKSNLGHCSTKTDDLQISSDTPDILSHCCFEEAFAVRCHAAVRRRSCPSRYRARRFRYLITARISSSVTRLAGGFLFISTFLATHPGVSNLPFKLYAVGPGPNFSLLLSSRAPRI